MAAADPRGFGLCNNVNFFTHAPQALGVFRLAGNDGVVAREGAFFGRLLVEGGELHVVHAHGTAAGEQQRGLSGNCAGLRLPGSCGGVLSYIELAIHLIIFTLEGALSAPRGVHACQMGVGRDQGIARRRTEVRTRTHGGGTSHLGAVKVELGLGGGRHGGEALGIGSGACLLGQLLLDRGRQRAGGFGVEGPEPLFAD